MEWVSFKTIMSDVNQIHIDTRDFECLTDNSHFEFDTSKIKNYPDRFFHTFDSVVKTIEDLYNRSGGEGTWRCLWLRGEGEKASENWNLKYIHIYRTEFGFVICGNDNKALSRDVLNSEMESDEILNTH